MRKDYDTPRLAVYGTVDKITGAFGNQNARDAIFYGGVEIEGYPTNGSQDGIVVPK